MHPSRWNSLVLLIAVAIVAAVLPGCMDSEYTRARDIVVLKLSGDGTQEWARTIDGGQDDAGEDMAELESGELVVVGQNGTRPMMAESPRVIRLSSNGRMISDRTITGRFDRPRAMVADPGGGFAVLMPNGEVTRYDRAGTAVWTCPSAMPEASSLTRLRDGGYLVGGHAVYKVLTTNGSSVAEELILPRPFATTATRGGSVASLEDAASVATGTGTLPTGAGGSALRVTTARSVAMASYTPGTLVERARAVKYSSDGELVWQRSYDAGITAVWSALEDPGDGSLLLAGPSDAKSGSDFTIDLVMLRTDGNGAAGSPVSLGQVEYQGVVRMRALPGGTKVLYSTKNAAVPHPGFGVISTIIDPAGRVTGERTLNASRVFDETSDSGIVSVGVPVGEGVNGYDSEIFLGPHPYTGFRALRFDSGSNLVWNRQLVSPGMIREVKRVIQTSDGGYAILGMT
jgi:hypothetical protein